jgi:hypothetical protein
MMKKIVLDIQSDIHAHTMERMLMQKLKLALNEANIIPMHIKLLDMKEESENKEQKPTNVYQNNYNNDFITSSRIDIKA